MSAFAISTVLSPSSCTDQDGMIGVEKTDAWANAVVPLKEKKVTKAVDFEEWTGIQS